jgi:hypothetical protein
MEIKMVGKGVNNVIDEEKYLKIAKKIESLRV